MIFITHGRCDVTSCGAMTRCCISVNFIWTCMLTQFAIKSRCERRRINIAITCVYFIIGGESGDTFIRCWIAARHRFHLHLSVVSTARSVRIARKSKQFIASGYTHIECGGRRAAGRWVRRWWNKQTDEILTSDEIWRYNKCKHTHEWGEMKVVHFLSHIKSISRRSGVMCLR